MAIELKDLLVLASGIGCIILYFKVRQSQREANEMRMERLNAEMKRAQEIAKETQKLKAGIVNKKEAYEKGLKIFRVHDGTDDSGNSDGSDTK